MKFLKKNYLLVAILLIAFFVRFAHVASQPPALNWDEVSHGYNAYSILKTGTDEWGSLPIANFRAYGDYPTTGNLYLTIPFVALFGLTSFAIRFPHVLLGVGTVLGSYFIALAVSKKKSFALLVAFLVSLGPWYIFTSRFVLQSNLSVFFLILSLALFFNRERSKYFLPAAIITLGLTLFSYHTTRIISPLILVSALLIYRKKIISKTSVILAILAFLPLPFILLSGSARARSNEVFLLNPGVVASIEELRNSSTYSPLITKALYNRPVYLVVSASKNYADYFSPRFLFFKGGTQYQFSVPGEGLMYPVLLPFFYIGLGCLIFNSLVKRNKDYQLILLWLLIAPLPAIITTERFAVLRDTGVLPLPEIISVLGFFAVIAYLKKHYKVSSKPLFIGLVVIIVCFSIRYLSVYFGNYRTQYSWAWQYGYSEVVDYATKNYAKYDTIITTKKYGEPHEFFLFYGNIDPAKYKTDAKLNRFTQSNWWWVDGFDKYVFVNDWQIPESGNVFITESKKSVDCTNQKCLLITSPNKAPASWTKVKTVYFLNYAEAFEIYEN